MTSLSPAARALLEVLQLRFGVAVEVVDPSLRPLHPETPSDFAGSLEEPGVRERCLSALRSGESRVARDLPVPVALCPIRRDREIVGLVVVASRGAPASDTPLDDHRQLEATAQVARAVLENDLTTTAQLSQARDRTRRLQGILRFIGQMAARDGEREMMQAVVQAATVWFDLDCRVYVREPDDTYALFAALPGLERGEFKPRLDGPRLRELVAGRRLSSASELELLGWPARRGEALLLGVGPAPDWVVVLTGAIDEEVEPTFAAITHVMAGELQQVAARRVEAWQQRLSDLAADPAGVAVERVMLGLLGDLVTATGAAGARLLVERGGSIRVLAGVSPGGEPVRREGGEPFVQAFSLAGGCSGSLQLWPGLHRFTQSSFAQVHAWVAAVRPWLSGGAVGITRDRSAVAADDAAFEARIQEEVERAKRFNLGLSLVVVETASPETIRGQLRSSDLLGRVRGGLLAVLLVHSAAQGAESFVQRVRARLESMVSEGERVVVRLGQAAFGPDCQSADALICRAMTVLEQSSVQA